jgi:hypothetical protein
MALAERGLYPGESLAKIEPPKGAGETLFQHLLAHVRVTHSPPADPSAAVELPQETKRRLGLDAERSWIVVSEGFAPDIARLQQLAAAEPESVAAALKRLEASHSVVCHPYHAAPWVIHPFSLSPTATWVQADQRGWWAPCIWCALGVAGISGSSRAHSASLRPLG